MQIEISGERESGAGWTFDARVIDDSGDLLALRLSLSWADYNLWCADGSAAPAEVAEAALRFIVQRGTSSGPRRSVDASLARRLDPEADTIIPTLIAR